MAVVRFPHRHLAILGLLATVAACGGRRAVAGPSPASPDQTIEQFLSAVNASDLERMSTLWGDERGPVSASNAMSEAERNQRLTIMQRMLRSDSHLITATDATDPAKRVVSVAMTQGQRRFVVPFTVVPTRAGGWLIREIGLDAAMPSASAGQRP